MKIPRSDWRTWGWQDRLLQLVPDWEAQNGRHTPFISNMKDFVPEYLKEIPK